jgi:hypothetical protein
VLRLLCCFALVERGRFAAGVLCASFAALMQRRMLRLKSHERSPFRPGHRSESRHLTDVVFAECVSQTICPKPNVLSASGLQWTAQVRDSLLLFFGLDALSLSPVRVYLLCLDQNRFHLYGSSSSPPASVSVLTGSAWA